MLSAGGPKSSARMCILSSTIIFQTPPTAPMRGLERISFQGVLPSVALKIEYDIVS